MTEWQPIDTAPKDGTHILACALDDPDMSIVSWRRGSWIGRVDGFAAIESQSDFHTDYFYPFVTHWMPLPSPPITDSGEKND